MLVAGKVFFSGSKRLTQTGPVSCARVFVFTTPPPVFCYPPPPLCVCFFNHVPAVLLSYSSAAAYLYLPARPPLNAVVHLLRPCVLLSASASPVCCYQPPPLCAACILHLPYAPLLHPSPILGSPLPHTHLTLPAINSFNTSFVYLSSYTTASCHLHLSMCLRCIVLH